MEGICRAREGVFGVFGGVMGVLGEGQVKEEYVRWRAM